MSIADLLTIVTAGVEYRADKGRVISGPVINYADIAMTRRGLERVSPGAFLGLNDPALQVNLQHRQQPAQRIATVGDGLLTFTDSPTALRADLAVPESDQGTQAIEGVQSGQLRGWSVEMMVVVDSRTPGTPNYSATGDITIFRALALGLGLVDVPAYKSSLVVLNRGGGGRFYYDKPIVRRDRGTRDPRKETYKSRAFTKGFAEGRAVQLYLQNTGKGAVASTATGSLKLTDTAAYLAFEVADFANTEAARDFIALAESDALDFGVRPLIQVPDYDDAFTDIPEPGNESVLIRQYENVILNGLLIISDKGVNPDVSDVMLNARRLAWL